MITLKELQYITTWANKVPAPGIEYSTNTMQQLKECLELFKQLYKDKEYNIVFSDGKELNFQISEKNLCHMFGIDYQNIRGDYFDNVRKEIFGTSTNDFTAYGLLEMILENADKVVQNDNDPRSSAKFVNYYKSQIKSEIFKKLSSFESFNFGAVTRVPDSVENESIKNETLLYGESGEASCPYFFIDLVPDSFNPGVNCVKSLVAPVEPQKYFKGEASIPTQLIISDLNTLRRIKATPAEKRQLLMMYKEIIMKYNLPNKLNIYGDYENMLCNAEKNETIIRERSL